MKSTITLASIFFFVFILACNKKDSSPPPTGGGSGVRPAPKDTSFITASVNGSAMKVTRIQYNRSSGSFNFTAQNDLQKVDVRCFHFYEPNRWNFQYSDSINYSKREDVLSTWVTTRAINWGDVYFNCCGGPLEDSVISGNYSGKFSFGEDEFKVEGNFHLLF